MIVSLENRGDSNCVKSLNENWSRIKNTYLTYITFIYLRSEEDRLVIGAMANVLNDLP